MRIVNGCFRAAAFVLCITALSTPAFANLLANPGFESGLTGWTAFGNAYAETNSVGDDRFIACEGTGLVSMFGNFSGGFNVSGIFQEFATNPGEEWTFSIKSRHWSGDGMIGAGAPNDNWVVQKLAFFDAGNNEIHGVESTILDGTIAVDVWHNNAAIVGVAPVGAVKVQALVLYLQPAFDGGAANVDAAVLTMDAPVPTEETTWGRIKSLF